MADVLVQHCECNLIAHRRTGLRACAIVEEVRAIKAHRWTPEVAARQVPLAAQRPPCVLHSQARRRSITRTRFLDTALELRRGPVGRGRWYSRHGTSSCTVVTSLCTDAPTKSLSKGDRRYAKAIKQLGSDKLYVRLDGIYALERVALGSQRDYPTVMEILACLSGNIYVANGR
jgi:hypothetical protein